MAMEMQKPKESSLPMKNPISLAEKRIEDPSLSSSPKQGEEEEPKELKPPTAEIASEFSTSAPLSHLQKKFLRAERFGMPVQLSEEEKRNSRAERFGTGSTLHRSEEIGKSEEQKRKSRAERFGLTVRSDVHEEATKKARLARFAPNSKPDTLEEDKRKARAIRFSQNSVVIPSQANGKSTKLSQKTTTMDETGGGDSRASFFFGR